jgi:hypothetical protein
MTSVLRQTAEQNSAQNWNPWVTAFGQLQSLHIIRLYEQLSKKKATPEEVASALGLYVKRWRRWTSSGLSGALAEPGQVSGI